MAMRTMALSTGELKIIEEALLEYGRLRPGRKGPKGTLDNLYDKVEHLVWEMDREDAVLKRERDGAAIQ